MKIICANADKKRCKKAWIKGGKYTLNCRHLILHEEGEYGEYCESGSKKGTTHSDPEHYERYCKEAKCITKFEYELLKIIGSEKK